MRAAPSKECLEPDGNGYRLRKQHELDDLFKRLPQDRGDKTPDEADIESLAVHDGSLWICGSRCKVRQEAEDDASPINDRIRSRHSRHLLGRVTLTEDGGDLEEKGDPLPYKGARSLRGVLRKDDFLKPFMDLPSKENGLDIEGLEVADGKLLLGLRGPRVDSYAVVVEVTESARPGAWASGNPNRRFISSIWRAWRCAISRGSARRFSFLAGPVADASGPFRLYSWRPDNAQKPVSAMNGPSTPASQTIAPS